MPGPTISLPFAGVFNQSGLERTRAWRSLVTSVLAANGLQLPVSLVLGVIYTESRGWPNEASGSLTDWFSSFGLMQINANQHWQSTGRPLADLLVPETNVDVGTRILASLMPQYGGDLESVVSAYNGGGRRYPAGTRFCQVWKPGTPRTGRDMDTMCAQAYVTRDNEFGNQPYVDEVLAATALFAQNDAGSTNGDGGGLSEAGMGGGLTWPAVLITAGVGVLGWLFFRRGR